MRIGRWYLLKGESTVIQVLIIIVTLCTILGFLVNFLSHCRINSAQYIANVIKHYAENYDNCVISIRFQLYFIAHLYRNGTLLIVTNDSIARVIIHKNCITSCVRGFEIKIVIYNNTVRLLPS